MNIKIICRCGIQLDVIDTDPADSLVEVGPHRCEWYDEDTEEKESDMGTNFYFYANETKYQHIGKRSAAGLYCWDCGVSLCNASIDGDSNHVIFGSDAVHCSDSHWLDICPVCGSKGISPLTMDGVSLCCSFRWAISPIRFADMKTEPNISIRDEYGEVYDIAGFQAVLKGCPIKYYESVGVEFF